MPEFFLAFFAVCVDAGMEFACTLMRTAAGGYEMDSIFGVSGDALKLCEERSKLIGDNLANGSTPGYKAKDIDFQAVLGQVAEKGASVGSDVIAENLKYRVPMQKSLDGNTVDPEIERKNFIQNAIRYQVSLTFVHNRTSELLQAIRGE
jgi:flagellar basal-body rod protein FlgB